MGKPSLRILRCLFLSVALTGAVSSLLAAPPEPAPLILPDADHIPLDELGLYAVGYQYRGQAERRFPTGWSGNFDAQTGVALQPAAEQNGRAAILLHPPWRGGTGISFQEFRFHLPPANAVRRIRLTGATALRLDAVAAAGEKQKSDGATFRVLANGRSLLDEHRTDTQWRPFDFDLSDLAGQTITLRFETDPGPRNDASFDFALWSGRELELEGFTPPLAVRPPPPPPLDLRRVHSVTNGEVAPLSGFAGTTSQQIAADNATLTYRGPDGTLEYHWTRPHTGEDPPFGRWQLHATPIGATAATIVPLAGAAELEWVGAAVFRSSRWSEIPGALECFTTYEVAGQPVSVHCRAELRAKSLVLTVRCDEPRIAALDMGRWGPTLHRRPVTVPYYTGQVFYLEPEKLFVNAFPDWTKSSASALEGTRAIYGIRTDGTRVPLHERLIFSAAWHATETLPNLPNPPSPFRDHLADRLVLDIWGGHFDEIAAKLERLHDYGLDHCAAIIHVWQRSGYDNALPAHVPANAALGGDDAMKRLVATAERLGYDIALHENYVDYYPNYEDFKAADVALDSQGKQVPAWYNAGTKVQSFAVQPHAILPLAREQSGQIQARYSPNADYLDVHSAVPPWFHVDFRAGAAGAGSFQTVAATHRNLWAFERETYHGPVLGEGANHWFWSGLLDGVEAQFGAGWPDNAGRTAPLMVDFDLLKIHPLQFNHGMGYYERWWSKPNWGALPPMEVLDQYRMQEVIYGHAAFLGQLTWSQLPLAWLEHHLLTPVTARYATSSPVNIQYQVQGRWVDSTGAAAAGTWRRARVTYDNGLVVTANDESEPLREGAFVLPRFGWLATGAGVTAGTTLQQEVIADYARTADSTFANARPAGDWNQSGVHRIRPAVAEFHTTGNRSFALAYEWQVGENPARDYHCFVHFVGGGQGEKILFQNDHPLPRPSSTWKPGETLHDGPHEIRLPDHLPDGDYGVRIGLFETGGSRLALLGRADGESRIRLGTLAVGDSGRRITFTQEAPSPDTNDLYSQRLNTAAKVLDFGDVRTDGSILVRREGAEWVLRALPRTREFLVELSAARFGRPTAVRCVEGAAPVAETVRRGDWWQLKLNGAHEYRWP